MRVGLVSNAYNEARFLDKFLPHIPSWVEEKLVLATNPPWYGDALPEDGTEAIAKKHGATYFEFPWQTEHEQRNFGQSYFAEFDWVLTIEPDEFLSDEGWEDLHTFLEGNPEAPSYAVKQRVFFGSGYESDPSEDFVPIIVTRPTVRFVDKRNVDGRWAVLGDDIELLHWAWGRTSSEIWKKISHYSHRHDFDIRSWFTEVWLKANENSTNLHPTTPESIPRLKKAVLPPEIDRLGLFPDDMNDMSDEEIQEVINGKG